MGSRKPRGDRPNAEVQPGASPPNDDASAPPAESRIGGEPAAEQVVPEAAGGPLEELPAEAVRRLNEELAEVRDRHLRLAAEYDNFRKRTARERQETWTLAQAQVVGNLLDALDDLGRVVNLDPASAKTEDVVKGIELVERKLLRELETAGLERVGRRGDLFDPNHHEAVGTLPAQAEGDDHKVGEVVQVGYRFGGALLRPARVHVLMWQGDGEASGD